MVNNQIFWAAYLGYVWGVLGYGDCYLYTVCPGTVTVFNLPIINIIRFPRHFLSLADLTPPPSSVLDPGEQQLSLSCDVWTWNLESGIISARTAKQVTQLLWPY